MLGKALWEQFVPVLGFNQFRYLIGHFTFSVAGVQSLEHMEQCIISFGRKKTQHQLKMFPREIVFRAL